MAEPLTITQAGSFCWNDGCVQYAQVNAGNIRRYGKTAKGVQRFQCKTCGRVFAATRGTPFYRIHDPEKMLKALAMLCERSSQRGVQRVLGAKPDTLQEWTEKAAGHVGLIEETLHRSHQVTRAQLDGLWAFVGHKGEKGGT